MAVADNQPASRSIDEIIADLSTDNMNRVGSIHKLDKEVCELITNHVIDTKQEIAIKAMTGDKEALSYVHFEKIHVLMLILCVSISSAINFKEEGAFEAVSTLMIKMFSDTLKECMKNSMKIRNSRGNEHDNLMD